MKMHTKLLGSLALSSLLLVGFSGCGNNNDSNETPVTPPVVDSDAIPFGSGKFTPYERVAVFPTVKNPDGTTNHVATYAKVAELANTFAKYLANVDETPDTANFKQGNWILGGKESNTTVNNFNDADVAHHMLAIPTKQKIDPTKVYDPANTKKVKVVELCNKQYAAMALGVTKVGGENGTKVANGSYHATALPCEVSIYNDDNGIYVDMLNPETIFTLFFTELFKSPEMENIDFKNAMLAMPTQVKNEIYVLIHNAFKGETYEKTNIQMGPLYTKMSEIFAATDTSKKGKEPYRHYNFKATDSTKEFTAADAKNIAQTIVAVMTNEHQADKASIGTQEAALFNKLPSRLAADPKNPLWRSGRLEPLSLPGGSFVVEACSPTYAKEALSTGPYHTTALPCEIAVTVNPKDKNSIDISILNPEFMFGALFADAMEKMSEAEIVGFKQIIDNINDDLKTIVDYTMDNNVSIIDGASGKKITPIFY